MLFVSCSSTSSSNYEKANIIGWSLLIFFSFFLVFLVIKDSFERVGADDENSFSQVFWYSFSNIYRNICSFCTTFGGLCVIYTWYNTSTTYNPIPSSLSDSSIAQINSRYALNQTILNSQNVNSLNLQNQIASISANISLLQSARQISSLDSCFYVTDSNVQFTQDCLTSITTTLSNYNSISTTVQNFINSIYTNVVLNQALYNNLLSLYGNTENWNYKYAVIAKLLDNLYTIQTNTYQSSTTPIGLQNIIFQGSSPISITQSGSNIILSFKNALQSSRWNSSTNGITISRTMNIGNPTWFSWNSIYPLSLYNIKASQGYSAYSSSGKLDNIIIQDKCSYSSPLLESDFKTNNFIKQVNLKNPSGLTVYNSTDLDTSCVYSDQNGLIVLESLGFVPSSLTFYYVSSGMLVVENYTVPSFTDSTLSSVLISFSLYSKKFYNYSDLPQDSNGNAYLTNNNFQVYFNTQLNQVSYLSLINQTSPFTLVKTLLNSQSVCSVTYPNPANTSYPYNTSRYQLNNNLIVSSSTNLANIYNIILTPI